jgi:hypothetical protein
VEADAVEVAAEADVAEDAAEADVTHHKDKFVYNSHHLSQDGHSLSQNYKTKKTNGKLTNGKLMIVEPETATNPDTGKLCEYFHATKTLEAP